MSASKTWLKALKTASELTADPAFTLGALLDRQAERFGAASALLSDGICLTYAELSALSRRYARWALSQGLGPGDCVALLAPNSPAYFAFWSGVTRTGVIVALINPHLKGDGLKHALATTRAKLIVAEDGLADAAKEALADAIPVLGLEVGPSSAAPMETAGPSAKLGDTALYIFTSGTTGLPKAARISHERIMSWMGWFCGLLGAEPSDRLYDCLPMSHSVGGITAIGAMLAAGGSVVLRERFSVGAFWSDVARFDCTMAQYTGELWRYLLAAPPHPDEGRHRLRLICGNGLREDVWIQAQRRFDIPRVLEFYAATEGVFSLYNVEGRPGALGRPPPFLAHRSPVVLVRFDPVGAEPIRGADGFCVACEPDEVGEALGRVAGRAHGAAAFEGYTDAQASNAKLMADVFRSGDLWFRTGDLMRKDRAGFFYFVDRIGDTFRWKSENASTQQIADVLHRAPGVRQAAVYGVAVAGADGRAGMAALVVDEALDLTALRDHLGRHLPRHGHPLFLRLIDLLPLTETLKVKTQVLAAEGFDPARMDRLYWLDPAEDAYRPLDAAVFDQIMAGARRL